MIPMWGIAGTVVAGGYFAIAARALGHRHEPGAMAFSTVSGLMGTLTLLLAGRQIGFVPVSMDPSVQLVLIAGYVFVALSWIAFVLEYTGRGPGLTRRRLTILAAFGGFVCLSTTVTWVIETGSVDSSALGQVTYLSTFLGQTVVFSFGVLGIILVLRSAIVDDNLATARSLLLAGGGLAISLVPVSIGFGAFLVGGSTWTLTMGQFGMILVLLSLCQYGDGLFAASPVAGYLGRSTALETMADPVFVTDGSQRVLDVNRAARQTFDVPERKLRTRTITDIVGIDPDDHPESSVEARTNSGRRQFSITRSAIPGVDGAVIGQSYRFKNVTKRETRKQRLQVFNRVIRHNLRNDLDAIRGFAEATQAADVDTTEKRACFERIETLAEDVVDTASTVDRSSELLAGKRLQREVISLNEIAADTAANVDTTVDLTTPSEPVSVRSSGMIVQAIIRELLDNAVKHAGSNSPAVGIRVEPTEDGGSITVWDDGPGIPERERAVLMDGEETPTKHGSGVGLWLVAWGVDRLGGTLDFHDRDPRGSKVRVRIPTLHDGVADGNGTET